MVVVVGLFVAGFAFVAKREEFLGELRAMGLWHLFVAILFVLSLPSLFATFVLGQYRCVEGRKAWLVGPNGVALHKDGKLVRLFTWSEIGTIEERQFGVAIVVTPESLRRRTLWHNRKCHR